VQRIGEESFVAIKLKIGKLRYEIDDIKMV